MNERLKELRATLGISQKEFSQRINIGQSTLAMFETGDRDMKDIHISQICSSFNVSEEWLRHGIGGTENMFINPTTFSLDEYAKAKSLSEKEIVLVREFMNLDPSVRSALYGMFEKAFSNDVWDSSPYDDCPKTPEELEKQFPPVEPQKNSDVG